MDRLGEEERVVGRLVEEEMVVSQHIFLKGGQHINSYTLVIIGQAFLRMLPNMLKDAIVAK